jgi:hypothetical protein
MIKLIGAVFMLFYLFQGVVCIMPVIMGLLIAGGLASVGAVIYDLTTPNKNFKRSTTMLDVQVARYRRSYPENITPLEKLMNFNVEYSEATLAKLNQGMFRLEYLRDVGFSSL